MCCHAQMVGSNIVPVVVVLRMKGTWFMWKRICQEDGWCEVVLSKIKLKVHLVACELYS